MTLINVKQVYIYPGYAISSGKQIVSIKDIDIYESHKHEYDLAWIKLKCKKPDYTNLAANFDPECTVYPAISTTGHVPYREEPMKNLYRTIWEYE